MFLKFGYQFLRKYGTVRAIKCSEANAFADFEGCRVL
jgi:hypothetical protein